MFEVLARRIDYRRWFVMRQRGSRTATGISHADKDTAAASHAGHWRPWLKFLQHLGEMFVAMMLGMPLFGMPERGIMAALGYSQPTQQFPKLWALLMTVNMTVPMVAWMRYRGHRWERSAEMAAAMVVPAIALIGLCIAGIIPDSNLSGVVMAPMLPAMLAVMLYRRAEYAHGGSHRSETARDEELELAG